jgi:hypothetical protein
MMSKQLLQDEEQDVKDVLRSQGRTLRQYRLSRWMLLSFGATCILGGLFWMLYKYKDLNGLDKFVPIFTVLGLGLISTAATTYPVKEILNRKDRMMFCEKLLANISNIRDEENVPEGSLERIQKKCSEAVDLLKGC